MDYKKLLEERKDFVKFIKENFGKMPDGIVRLKTKEITAELGTEESNIDTYYGLRTVLWDEGIVTGTGTHKDGDAMLTFWERTSFDSKPVSKEEEMTKNAAWYKELDEEVHGLSEIAKMEGFNAFDPEKIIKIIRMYKDVIEKVRMENEESIGIMFKKDVNVDNLLQAFVDMVGGCEGFEADVIDYDNGEVSFWWE